MEGVIVKVGGHPEHRQLYTAATNLRKDLSGLGARGIGKCLHGSKTCDRSTDTDEERNKEDPSFCLHGATLVWRRYFGQGKYVLLC